MLTQDPFYNSTTEKVVAGFIALFNNIKIERADGTIYKVPLKYGGRQKYLKYIRQLNDAEYSSAQVRRRLPIMSFELVDFEYDSERQKSKLVPLRIQNVGDNEADSVLKFFQPVPYNLTIELTIVARKESEVFQVFEQIIPYFSPDFTINIKPIEGVTNHVDDVPFKLLSSTFQADRDDRDTIDEREFIITFQAPVKYYSQKKTRQVIRRVELVSIEEGAVKVTQVSPFDANLDDDWTVSFTTEDLESDED